MKMQVETDTSTSGTSAIANHYRNPSDGPANAPFSPTPTPKEAYSHLDFDFRY